MIDLQENSPRDLAAEREQKMIRMEEALLRNNQNSHSTTPKVVKSQRKKVIESKSYGATLDAGTGSKHSPRKLKSPF